MLRVEKIDPKNKRQIKQFVEFPFRLYQNVPQWVPPFRMDIRVMLNPEKHPFYEHSPAQAFIALQNEAVVGRIIVMENRLYNRAHQTRQASFNLLEIVDDPQVLAMLFAAAETWAKEKGLTEIVGPKPMGLGEGYGILVEGFELRQMMTMMNYNFPYLPRHMEANGFEKVVDFVSCQIEVGNFTLPEKMHRVAERVIEKGSISVRGFHSRGELRSFGKAIGKVYNEIFIHNWEYYPYTQREIEVAVDAVTMFSDPGLIKVLMDKDKVIGFLFAFPDMSAGIQKHKGRLNPLSILDLFSQMKKANWVAVNGTGVLPEYYGAGGNALLYAEMEKTIKSRGFTHAEFTQVAESAQQMRKDLLLLGGKEAKNHRVYRRAIN